MGVNCLAQGHNIYPVAGCEPSICVGESTNLTSLHRTPSSGGRAFLLLVLQLQRGPDGLGKALAVAGHVVVVRAGLHLDGGHQG